jgi:hypothetical protein
MARRYARDNRGRFSSTGATARGGRLRTAAGNKRKTVIGRQEGVQPKNTISAKRKANPVASVPAAQPRLTPREKARRLGALPQRQSEGPRVTTSIPRGTVGTNTPVRNMSRVDRALKQVKPQHSSQMAVAEVFRGGGQIASAGPQQLRRALVGRSQKITGIRARAAYKGYTSPSLAEFKKRERAALSERRSSHSPRKRK